jgi:hypothetical protein
MKLGRGLLLLTALAPMASSAQPPAEAERPAAPTAPAPTPTAAAGPSLAVCLTKVLTPPEKAYCCSAYSEMRRRCR